MKRNTFTFDDFIKHCDIEENTISLQYKAGVKSLGLRITVPSDHYDRFPFNASAYDFLQFFRQEIYHYGIIEIPNLPVNQSNYTVAMRAPEEHSYSANPYLYERCQAPHQDTPPYPTAFWLGQERLLSATWVMTDLAAEYFFQQQNDAGHLSIEELHRTLVPKTLEEGSGILLNHTPGLLLIDNSQHHQLYHAKTSRFKNRSKLVSEQRSKPQQDNPMYTFNEVGLIHYIDSLDEQRGLSHRDPQEREWVQQFMLNAD